MGFSKESVEKVFKEMGEKIVAEMQAADSVKQGGKILADNLLPQLKIANNFFGRTIASSFIKSQFNKSAADLRAGKMDAQMKEYSDRLRAYSRNDIKAKIAARLNAATDPAVARANAEKAAKGMSDMTVTEYTDLIRAAYAVLPPALSSVYDRVVLNGRTLEQYALYTYNMTVDQRAKAQLDVAAQFPVDDLADYVHAQLQKAGPQEVKTAALTVLSKLTADDAAGFALEGMNFAEDSLKMIKEKNILGVKDAKKAAQFGDRLKKILTAVETGLIAAGLHDQKAVDAIINRNFGGPSAGNTQKPPKFG